MTAEDQPDDEVVNNDGQIPASDLFKNVDNDTSSAQADSNINNEQVVDIMNNVTNDLKATVAINEEPLAENVVTQDNPAATNDMPPAEVMPNDNATAKQDNQQIVAAKEDNDDKKTLEE